MAQSDQIEKLKLFVATLINEEQDAHSKLIEALGIAIGKTTEFDDTIKVLNKVYETKIDLLEKIYKKMLGM